MENLKILTGEQICVCHAPNACETIVSAAKEFTAALRALTGTSPQTGSLDNVAHSPIFCVVLALFSDFSAKFAANPQVTAYENELWDTDGFAVVRQDDALFILSHTPSGIYFGTHDLLEKKFGVLYPRGAKEYAFSHTPFPKTGVEFGAERYMEKSPFFIRAWNLCGVGSEGKSHADFGTAVSLAKNKCNGVFHSVEPEWLSHGLRGTGVVAMPANRLDDLIEEYPELFMTDIDGNPKSSKHESFLNYYNPRAAEAVAARMLAFLQNADGRHLYEWIMPDNPYFFMREGEVELSAQPFTTDDGVTVQPTDANYKSTVYFNFLNRVVRRVNESRPDTNILTFAYLYSEQAPATQIDERLVVALAPIYTNERYAYTEKESSNRAIAENIERWSKKCKKLCVYSYWSCFKGDIYTRPILRQIQENLLWFERLGVYGVIVEGRVDCSLLEAPTNEQRTARKFYDMNEGCTWVMQKLLWNPRANVDELLKEYAERVYGETASEFLRYYALVEQGFHSTDAYVWYPTGGDVYILRCIVEAGLAEALLDVLRAGKEKAKNPTVRTRWESMEQTLSSEICKYADFVKEEGSILRLSSDADICSQRALDYKNNPDSVWNQATPMRILRSYKTMEYYPEEAQFECRMLWKDARLYVGYSIADDGIARTRFDQNGRLRIEREDGSTVESYAETYLGGNELNQSTYYGYISGFTPQAKGDFYQNEGTPVLVKEEKGLQDYYFAHLSPNCKERYYFHVQEIPLSALGVTEKDFKPYGSFVYYTNRFGRAGWMGFGLWSKQNFQSFKIKREK